MLKNRFWVVSLLLLMTVIVSACSTALTEEEAENGLKAAFEGNSSRADEVFCDDANLDEIALPPENIVFKDVACEKDSDENEMVCTTGFEANGQEHHIITVFQIRDNELCEFTFAE